MWLCATFSSRQLTSLQEELVRGHQPTTEMVMVVKLIYYSNHWVTVEQLNHSNFVHFSVQYCQERKLANFEVCEPLTK